MLLDIVKKGIADRSVTLRILDSTDGTPETGVVYNSSGIDLWYRREGGTKTSITEASLAGLDSAHADGGFLHIGDGYYRLDLPDAAFATGANYVDIGGTVTGMVVVGGRVRLVNFDLEDGVRGGLTALPNAAADAAGGLPISDAGGLDMDGLKSDVAAILTDTGTTLDALIKDVPTVAEFEARTLPSADYTVVSDLPPAPLDAAGVRGAVGLASANLDMQFAALPTAAENADAVWDEAISGHAIPGSTGEVLSDAGATGTPPTVGEIADAVWDEAVSDHLGAGSTGSGLNAAGSAGDPWATALPGAYGAGSAGKIVGDNINATISSRSSLTAQQVWEYATRTLSSFGTLVSDIWGAVTRSLTDKAGFTLHPDYNAAKTAAQAGNQMDLVAAPNATAVSAIKSGLALDATVAKDATVMKAAGYTAPDNAGIAALPTLAEIEASAVLAKEATVSAVGGVVVSVGADVDAANATLAAGVTVAANNDKGGYALSDAGVDAILDEVVDGAVTTRQALRVLLALLASKCSGGGSATLVFRDVADGKNRVTLTVDENGNRSAVVLDLT